MVRHQPGITVRNRCYGCFRPVSECYCDAIPLINNQTELLIVQHSRERDHPFNTARMVRQGLANSTLICGTSEALSRMELPIRASTGLLYPSHDARSLSGLSSAEKPDQLVIVDGTWSQAKTMVRDIEQLATLPRYQLAPSQPGQYRIRLEPTDTTLSTVEAAVTALRELEPETQGLDQLLGAFELMVQKQLDHPNVGREHYSGGPKTGHSINIPQRMLGDADGIVVAYGEAAYRDLAQLNSAARNAPRPPLYWVAQRLGTGEKFAQALRPDVPLTDSFLKHLELSRDCFASAVSPQVFLDQWRNFVRPDDLVIVYNQGIIQLLKSIESCLEDFQLENHLTLKSIDFDQTRRGLTLSQYVTSKGLLCQRFGQEHGRAGKRLANAIALVNHLRSL